MCVCRCGEEERYARMMKRLIRMNEGEANRSNEAHILITVSDVHKWPVDCSIVCLINHSNWPWPVLVTSHIFSRWPILLRHTFVENSDQKSLEGRKKQSFLRIFVVCEV